jgi:hypothetical protein
MKKNTPDGAINQELENQSNDSISSSSCLIFPRVNITAPSEIQKAWIAFLKRYSWAWFATLTFHKEVHPEQANKRFKRWIRHLNENLYGKRFREKHLGVLWSKAIEYQKRGTLHFHALMGPELLKDVNHFEYMNLWYNKGNGFARIYPYDPEKAEWYVSKYVVKGGEIDIFLPPSYKDREKMLSLSLLR